MAGRFPTVRPRRLRGTERLRRLVRETRLAPEQLVLPLFVIPGRGKAIDVPSMPGVKQWSVDRVSEAVGYAHPTSFTAAFRRHFGMRPIDLKAAIPRKSRRSA